jgi:MFS family permease
MVSGSLIGTVMIVSTTNPPVRYAACILANLFSTSYYPPYWAWRAGYLSGSSGGAFAMGLQSSIAQLGAVVGPQFFQSKWAPHGYRNSFLICLGLIVAAQIANLYTWRLTRNVESQVQDVRREVLRCKKEGREYDGHDDIDVLGDETLKNHRLW